jgi:asparagine synthetase B (glutamine-hydrolysing)
VRVFDRQGNEISRTRLDAPASVRYGGESEAEVGRALHDLLAQAVERRLENNPQPVALLSGGVDSTIVTEIAAERLRRAGDGRQLKLLTLGAMVPYTQDEYFARFAAKRLGLPLEIVRPPRQRLPDAIRHAVAQQDEPLGMPSYFFLFQLVAAAAPHGKVVLTGDGGDEVFLGYRPSTDWQSHALDRDDEASAVDVGPGASAWMGSWARDATGNTLLGHMFTKLDRASAEQGVETRCPLLDSDVIAYVRSLPPEISCRPSSLKPLLKEQLADWPHWFVERRKLGFAYNLRWHWGLTRFADLREMIAREAVETFADRLPPPLRAAPQNWHTRDIFHHFSEAWRLMVWSAFIDRLANATRASPAFAAQYDSRCGNC